MSETSNNVESPAEVPKWTNRVDVRQNVTNGSVLLEIDLPNGYIVGKVFDRHELLSMIRFIRETLSPMRVGLLDCKKFLDDKVRKPCTSWSIHWMEEANLLSPDKALGNNWDLRREIDLRTAEALDVCTRDHDSHEDHLEFHAFDSNCSQCRNRVEEMSWDDCITEFGLLKDES